MTSLKNMTMYKNVQIAGIITIDSIYGMGLGRSNRFGLSAHTTHIQAEQINFDKYLKISWAEHGKHVYAQLLISQPVMAATSNPRFNFRVPIIIQ